MKSIFALGVLIVAVAAAGCSSGGSSSSSSGSSNTAVTAVTAVSTGIKKAGTAMTTGAFRFNGQEMPKVTSSSCDAHGQPQGLSGTSDALYPGYFTYCSMTVDSSGDTVLGAFDTPNMVSCLLTQAGIQYGGVQQTVTITDAMLAACPSASGNVPSGTVITMTGSSPASFNSNFTYGVILNIASFGLTFHMATSFTNNKISFLTEEAWSSPSAYSGVGAGTLDTSTGDLWYERRDERGTCTTSGSCGWNRHTRIHALLTMSGTTPTGLSSISFAYSNISYTPGQSAFMGTLITASGDLTTGIKGRLWQANDGSTGSPAGDTDYTNAGHWAENAGSSCFTSASETATTCGTGISGMSSSTNFVLAGSDSHTTVSAWLTAFTPFTFTSVNVNDDTQF